MSRHLGNLDIYGTLSVSQNTSGGYYFPESVGSYGEFIGVTDSNGNVTFSNVGSYVDLVDISGGQAIRDDVDYVMSVIDSISGGELTSFTGLLDTPNSYTGEAGKIVSVNGTEDALEFSTDFVKTVNASDGEVNILPGTNINVTTVGNNITISAAVSGAMETDHNDLSNLQGGDTGEYYHLTNDEYSDLIGSTEVAAISASLTARVDGISGELNDIYVNTTGDTMTGSLVVHDTVTSNDSIITSLSAITSGNILSWDYNSQLVDSGYSIDSIVISAGSSVDLQTAYNNGNTIIHDSVNDIGLYGIDGSTGFTIDSNGLIDIGSKTSIGPIGVGLGEATLNVEADSPNYSIRLTCIGQPGLSVRHSNSDCVVFFEDLSQNIKSGILYEDILPNNLFIAAGASTNTEVKNKGIILNANGSGDKNSLQIQSDVSSTNTSTGALVVAGGVGIGENVFTAGDIYDGGLTPSVSGNFLTWDYEGKLIDSGYDVAGLSTLSTATSAGVEVVDVSTGDAVEWLVSVKSSTNVRTSKIISATDGSSVEYNEYSTSDIGDTSGVVLSVDYSGGMRLKATISDLNIWTIKAVRQEI